MHTKPMQESEGEFGGWQQVSGNCPRCGKQKIRVRTWESFCGGYEDDKFDCQACGHRWWVDGSDA